MHFIDHVARTGRNQVIIMRTKSWLCLLVGTMLLVTGCDLVDNSGGGGSTGYSGSGGGSTESGSEPSEFRRVIATLSQARDADETAVTEIADATGGAGACYETAANQYMNAAASYNAWISDMVASIEQGNSITEFDLRSADLERAAAYSTLLRENAERVAQNNSSTFGMIRTASFRGGASAQQSLLLCPFLTVIARAAVEAAVSELVSRGLAALMDNRAGDNDDALRASMVRQLEESRWSDLSTIVG
jgi:hypothetical protein